MTTRRSTLHQLEWTMSGTEDHDCTDSTAVIREFHASLKSFAFSAMSLSRKPTRSRNGSIQGIEQKCRLPSDERGVRLGLKTSMSSGLSSQRNKKRGYAAPETYAHLSVLQDILTDSLDGTLSVYIVTHNLSMVLQFTF